MAPIRVAAVQVGSPAFDLAASIGKLEDYVTMAAQGGAKLVVFPEAYLSAYPRFLSFEIGRRTDENRHWYKRYVESSVKVPDGAEGFDWLSTEAGSESAGREFESFRKLCQIAKKHSVFLSVGIVERSIVGATLFCSNILIDSNGVLLSKHRKLVPTAAERVVWGTSSATNQPAFLGTDDKPTDNLPVVWCPSLGFRIGGNICWENYCPLQRYALYRKGVSLYLAPTADARPTWQPSMQHIAMEGRTFVVSANQLQKASDFPEDYPARVAAGGKDEVWSRGGSCIVSPLGEVLAGPLWDEEGILYADIDADDILGAKLDMDCAGAGHYAREDIFRFDVRT
ncbi:Nitrilase [Rhodotorula toruloides]